MIVSSAPEQRAVRDLEVAGAAAVIAVAGRLGEGVTGPALDRVIRHLARRHARAFAVLAQLPEASVVIDPTDQGWAMALTVGPVPSVRIVAREGRTAEAWIRGPLSALLDLIEGRIDGDALFFRRELKIEGDTELVVAVRNAFDGEDMDLAADLASILGPVEHWVAPARRKAGQLAEWALHLRAAILAPVNARIDGLERRVSRLDRQDG